MEHTTFRTELEQRIAYLKALIAQAPDYEGRTPDYWDGKLYGLESVLEWLNDYIAHSNGQEPEDEKDISE